MNREISIWTTPHKITFSTDFGYFPRQKKGTIGKYRWFPVDWPLYGGSSIAKKSFAEPLHLSFFLIFWLKIWKNSYFNDLRWGWAGDNATKSQKEAYERWIPNSGGALRYQNNPYMQKISVVTGGLLVVKTSNVKVFKTIDRSHICPESYEDGVKHGQRSR